MNNFHYLAIILVAFSLNLHISPVLAQAEPNRADKHIQIIKTDTPPRIDGDLSDPVWSKATYRDDFMQMSPVEYREPSERTEVYITYDENALYVGFFVHDSKPDEITNFVLEQDGTLRSDDKVSLVIDPFNNQRSGYLFQVNPNGVISEAIYISGTRPSFDWEGIWNAAAQEVEGGWTAELEIPFKSLSFDPDNDTWGINFARHLQRASETISWYSLNGVFHPASSGSISGIENASQGIGLDVVPAFAGTYFKDHPVGSTDSNAEPSVDIFYKINPQVNLAVTVNTDFSATEADENSLNLSEFRRFFEEKRAFFLNDFDAFNFGLTNLNLNGVESGNNALAFYSRRIGLDDGKPVDIDGGIKLSGRIGETEFGTLVMRQKEHYVDDGNGGQEIIDATSAVVARIAQPIFNESKIGAIFTNGNPSENQSNSLYGLDFHYRDTSFVDGKSLDALLIYQQTDDPDFDADQSSYSGVVSVNSNEGFTGGVQYFVVEENYSPGLGFTQRTNAELFSVNLSHTWVTDTDLIQEFSSTINASRWNDFDTGNLDSEEFSWTIANIEFSRGDEFRARIWKEDDVVVGRNPTGDLGFTVADGTYALDGFELVYEAPAFWDISPSMEFERQDYYSGKSTGITPSINWNASKHFRLSAEYELTKFEFFGATTYTRELGLDVNVAFNSKVSFSSGIEYNNVNRELTFNNRLRWNFQPGQDLWVVFNQGRIDEDEDDRFRVTDTSAAFKFVYTFRY